MKFKLKDPGSAITHGIAFLLAAVGAAPLLIRSSEWSDHIHIVALGVFILTMMLLYAASTLYHSVDSTAKVNRRLKKLDHMMIFVLIAGSYTPVCLIVLGGKLGYTLLALVWGIAAVGMLSTLGLTQAEAAARYGKLSRYCFPRDIFPEVVREEHTLELWSAHFDSSYGQMWVYYSQAGYDETDTRRTGSFRIPSLWYLERTPDGAWEVISIKEHP